MSGFSIYSQRLSLMPMLLLGVSLLFTACTKDDAIEGPVLEGRWEIDRALRNGRPAESLTDLFFQFGPEQAFATNISGVAESGTFSRTEEKISTDGVSMPLTYTLVELGDSNLHLKATVANFRFEFYLRRIADEKENSTAT